MAGAVIYVLLFNMRYAVIDRRTYSLASSIEGATWLIIYSATTAAIAVILGLACPDVWIACLQGWSPQGC